MIKIALNKKRETLCCDLREIYVFKLNKSKGIVGGELQNGWTTHDEQLDISRVIKEIQKIIK